MDNIDDIWAVIGKKQLEYNIPKFGLIFYNEYISTLSNHIHSCYIDENDTLFELLLEHPLIDFMYTKLLTIDLLDKQNTWLELRNIYNLLMYYKTTILDKMVNNICDSNMERGCANDTDLQGYDLSSFNEDEIIEVQYGNVKYCYSLYEVYNMLKHDVPMVDSYTKVPFSDEFRQQVAKMLPKYKTKYEIWSKLESIFTLINEHTVDMIHQFALIYSRLGSDQANLSVCENVMYNIIKSPNIDNNVLKLANDLGNPIPSNDPLAELHIVLNEISAELRILIRWDRPDVEREENEDNPTTETEYRSRVIRCVNRVMYECLTHYTSREDAISNFIEYLKTLM